jgi:hypothetical protein
MTEIIEGFNKMMKDLQGLENVDPQKVILAGAMASLKGLYDRSPFDTNYMRSNVEVSPDGEDAVQIRWGAEYSFFQNFGWTDKGGNFHEGKHFAEKTFDEDGQKILDAMAHEAEVERTK